MSVRAPALLLSLAALACGKPVDPSGREDASFTRASMGLPPAVSTDPNRPLAADLAVVPVSMLVMFNRLQTPEQLQEVLNRTPGQFSRVDIDKDSAPDPLTVAKRDLPDGHAFEIHARPPTGEFVVATMMFDREWSFTGHYDGVLGGAASTVSRPLPAAGTTPLPTTTPAPVAATPPAPDPALAAAPAPAPAVAAGVQAVPASSGQEAGVKTSAAN
jgi:hypothetical protein